MIIIAMPSYFGRGTPLTNDHLCTASQLEDHLPTLSPLSQTGFEPMPWEAKQSEDSSTMATGAPNILGNSHSQETDTRLHLKFTTGQSN